MNSQLKTIAKTRKVRIHKTATRFMNDSDAQDVPETVF